MTPQLSAVSDQLSAISGQLLAIGALRVDSSIGQFAETERTG
jgi:hypothetical protein